MNGVIGFTDLLLASDLSAEQRRHAELIADSGRAMMRLLNDILDLSKIEAGQLVIAAEPVSLRETIGNAIEMMAPVAQAKGIALGLTIDPAVPTTISGDGLRLRQVLLNLVNNAVKFTDRGSVTMSCDYVAGDQDTIRISVIDTGVGIPADRLAAIREPFQQADDSTARRFGGTGLGLAISEWLIALMGGALDIESTPGRGSRFRITLPLRLVPGDAAPAVEPGVGARARPSRILVVEDNDVNQALVRAMLERRGHAVEIVSDGAEAMARLTGKRAGGRARIDLVLMDMQMPGIDGVTATRLIRERGIDAGRLPIVAMTANAFAEDVRRCLDAGMQAHLAKPMTIDALDAVLAACLGAANDSDPGRIDYPSPIPQALIDRYRARRDAAIDDIRSIVADGALDDRAIPELIGALHKLAGMAGMFGEEAIGAGASRLEYGLAEWDAATRIAEMQDFIRLADKVVDGD